MFNRGTEGGDISTAGLYKRKGLVSMVAYDDLFTFVIMLCAVVTFALRIKRKK